MRNSLAVRIRLALGVIAVVAVLCAWTGAAGGAGLVGELVSASGPVEIRPLGQAVWRVASQRIVLQPGDMVRTGPGGAAEMAFVTGVVRMDENTVIILPRPQAVPASAGHPAGLHLFLQGGRALFRVLKNRLQGTFEVITPSIIVGVKGTTFGVEQGPNLGVVVFEGIVGVAQMGRSDLPPVEVRGGQYTILTHGRLTAPRAFAPGLPGPVWNEAPTRTTSHALPVRGGGRSAPTFAPEGGPSAAATDGPSGLSISGLAGASSEGATGVNADAPLGVTGSSPPVRTRRGDSATGGGTPPRLVSSGRLPAGLGLGAGKIK